MKRHVVGIARGRYGDRLTKRCCEEGGDAVTIGETHSHFVHSLPSPVQITPATEDDATHNSLLG